MRSAVLCVVLLSAPGCGGDDGPDPPRRTVARGPMSGVPSGVEVDGGSPPLAVAGIYGAEHLAGVQKEISDPERSRLFGEAFRSTFSADRSLRDYAAGAAAARAVIERDSLSAPAHRVLGFALFHEGRAAEGLAALRRSASLDPAAGAPLYDLAFLSAMGDRAAGVRAYRRALELGVSDERDLGPRFYDREP